MKAERGQLERALNGFPADLRFILLYGPDEAGSRALMKSAAKALDAERAELSGAELKTDPARLADEAGSNSLFGGARLIVVESAGDEILDAVEALLDIPQAGNPVILVAGALKPTSKLVKLALASRAALAHASYVPDARHLPRLVQDLAREQGLTIRQELARRIADAAAGNRAIIAQELAKLALYVDAAPNRPKAIEENAVEAIGAGREEGDPGRLVDCVARGDSAGLKAELTRLASVGQEGIPLIRAMLRRMSLLAKLRAEVDAGASVAAVMASSGKGIFWKEKDMVAAQLARWPAATIAKSMSRLVEAELQVKASGGLGPLAAEEELYAISRQAARLR